MRGAIETRLERQSLVSGDEVLRSRLFALYNRYFENSTPEVFFEHLSHKDAIFILSDARSGEPIGFSTQKLLRAEVDGVPIVAIFSGDTIIDRSYWGQQELVKSFSHACGRLAARKPRQARFYWFLISKGYKTYRFLPVFFRSYDPCWSRPFSPGEKRVLDALATGLYPREYNPSTGLITFTKRIGNLRYGVGDVTPSRLRDRAVRFFAERNPEHMKGVELACLAEMCSENLRGLARAHFDLGAEGGPPPYLDRMGEWTF
jgi:hypothetical protein